MVCEPMSPQVDFSIKCPRAKRTIKRFVSTMLSHVSDQVRRLTKALPTGSAQVGALPGMNIRVLLHVRLLVESLSAEATSKRAGVAVDEHVRA